MADLQRPGGELASRPIHFFWVVDCSGSMSYDGKMEVVNTAIEECIPEMASAADNNPNAQLLIRALQFSSGAIPTGKRFTLCMELHFWVC